MRKMYIYAVVAAALVSCGTTRSMADGLSDSSQIQNDGYQKIDGRKSAHSITSLDVKDGETASYNTIFDYLRGRVPGVQIGYAGPGGTPTVTIRGENSFNASTQPLYVVDGAVVSDISSLNPNDVASVNVLKDSSTSIYGSRGAGGVIVFTTKMARAAAAAAAAERKAQKAAEKSAKKGK